MNNIFRKLLNAGKYTAFNIIGLTLGLSLTILILLLISYELSFDKFHTNADEVYCVLQKDLKDGSRSAITPYPLPATLKNNFPEVKAVVGINPILRDGEITCQNIVYSGFSGATSNSDIFSVFDFKLLLGNEPDVLDGPNKVVVSQNTAKKIFGSENPVGKEIFLDKYGFTISGVFADLPANSSMQFDLLFSEQLNAVMWSQAPVAWWASSISTFVVLEEGVSIDYFNTQLQQIPEIYYPDFLKGRSTYTTIPFIDLHFETSIYNGLTTAVSFKYLLILGAISILTLAIACLNFISLSTIKTRKNSTEVGIRKIFGASPSQLIKVHFSSSGVVIVISIVLGILMSRLVLPVFEHFVDRTLFGQFLNPKVWMSILLLGILLVFITGVVPGALFSRLKPISIFKSNSLLKSQTPYVRNAFIVFQFALTICLLTSQFFIYKQIRGMKHADLGFDFENVVSIDLGYLDSEVESPYAKIKTFKAEIERYGTSYGLGKGSVTENVPGYYFQNGFTVIPEGSDIGECLVKSTAVDKDYLELFKVKLLYGRFFSDEHKVDKNAFLINETAMKRFGWQDIEGKYIRLRHEGDYFPVIGVLQDIVETSLKEKTNPMIFRYEEHNNFPAFLSFRIKPEKYKETIAFMESTWKGMFPDVPFHTLDVKETYYANYKEEKELVQVIGIMSAIAIVLTVLGLLGVIAYITELRTKEIGIRKVNGAKVLEILNLLNKEILTWILISTLVASPLAYFAMNKWLENFAYKTTLSWWIFVLAGFIALAIALITVSWQSWRAASRNPVEALRYE